MSFGGDVLGDNIGNYIYSCIVCLLICFSAFCFFIFIYYFLCVLSQFRVLFNSYIYIEFQGKELLNEIRNERYIPIPVNTCIFFFHLSSYIPIHVYALNVI